MTWADYLKDRISATFLFAMKFATSLLACLLVFPAMVGSAEESRGDGSASDGSLNLAARMLPAPRGGAFRMDDYWVWDGSVIKGDNGRYHMFASRWSKRVCFAPNWVACSEVVRAVSDTPEGPYHFVETVIKRRGPEYWDGMMSHNPTIRKCGKKYLLFYTGTTYRFPYPDASNPVITEEQYIEARMNQQIGMLVSDSLEGPWLRSDWPVIPRNRVAGAWDSMTTNASPCILPDGSIRVIYKGVANHQDFMRLGVAEARAWNEPFVRMLDHPLFEFDQLHASVEDPFFWYDGRRFNLLMKDMTGALCGEEHGGLYASSADAIHWTFRRNEVAYSRKVTWSDGTTTVQGNLERPSLLLDEQGIPTHFFAATAAVHFSNRKDLQETYVMVIPLAKEPKNSSK